MTLHMQTFDVYIDFQCYNVIWLCSMRELSSEQRNWLEINVYRVLENTGLIVNPDMSALFCIYMCIITYVILLGLKRILILRFE